MATKRKIPIEAKIGIIGILSIAVLVWGLNFLKGRALFGKSGIYYSVYTDLGGLLPKSNVFINGMKVGNVNKITYGDASLKSFIVKLEINSDIILPIDSKVEVFSHDILGSKAMRVIIGESSAYFEKGDTIPSAIEKSMMSEIQKKLDPLQRILESTDSVGLAIKNILNEDTQKELVTAFNNLNLIFQSISSATAGIDGIIQKEKGNISTIISDVHDFTNALSENTDKLSVLVTNITNISDTLSQANLSHTFQELNTAITSLSATMKKIDKGEGNIGMLISRDSLYINLENSTKKLELLLDDIKKNPKRYVKVSVF